MFAILGVRKLKDKERFQKRASHHLRNHLVQNADPARASLNAASWRGTAAQLTEHVWQVTEPAMQRKDGVRALEFNLTASPEWFANDPKGRRASQLTQGAKEFLEETFGAGNIAAIGLHRDESSPHIWAIVTPIKDGKLRAAHWVDGPQKMAALHTAWSEKMKPHGLQRGAHKSGAKHVDIRTYYAAVNGNASAEATIAREMQRRASSAKKRAEEAEAKLAEIEARERRSRAVFDALSQVEQERAAQIFADQVQRTPSLTHKKAPMDRLDGPEEPKPPKGTPGSGHRKP